MSHFLFLFQILSALHLFTLLRIIHAQVNVTYSYEFFANTSEATDATNWSLKKVVNKKLGNCSTLTDKYFLGGNPDFFNQTAFRNINMKNMKAHYALYFQSELVLMGLWGEKQVMYIKYNSDIRYSNIFYTVNQNKLCSPAGPVFLTSPVDFGSDTNNEKSITLSVSDYQLGVAESYSWGLRKVSISFLTCETPNSEFNYTTRKCQCISGFYLSSTNECHICPLGCVCKYNLRCPECKFAFQVLDTTNNLCTISEDKYTVGSVLEAWTAIPHDLNSWNGIAANINPNGDCGTISFFGGVSKFNYETHLVRVFSNLQNHYKLSIQFVFYKLDAWDDNMSFSFLVDDVTAHEISFSSYADDRTGSLCYGSDFEAIRRVELALDHSAQGLKLEFQIKNWVSSTGYWAISDLNITSLLCHSSCKTCLTSYEKACVTCYDGFIRSDPTKDRSNCQIDCSKFAFCTDCTSTECIACNPNYFLLEDLKTCHLECPKGYYSENSASTDGLSICSPCNKNIAYCSDCKYSSSTKSVGCTLCVKDGVEIYLRGDSSCSEICLAKETPIDTSPKYCKLCSLYGAYCEICNPDECLSCESPKLLDPYNGGICVESCPAGMYQETSKKACNRCTNKYVGCKACYEQENAIDVTCTSCITTYFLQNYYCVQSCAPYDYGENNKCVACNTKIPFCEQCSQGIYILCLKCNPGYIQQAGGCSADPCPKGQYLNTNSASCETCMNLFKYCENCDSEQCIKCGNSRFVSKDGLKCVLDCNKNQYLYDNTKCKLCSDLFPYCARCTNLQCTACSGGYFLDGNTCTSKSCSINQFYDSMQSSCFNCIQAQYKCIECFKKDQVLQCEKCDDAFNVRYDGDNTSCVDDCSETEVFVGGECFPCSTRFPGCLTCRLNALKEYECESCPPELFLSTAKDGCISKCSETEVALDQTNICTQCSAVLEFPCDSCQYENNKAVCLKCSNNMKMVKTFEKPKGETCQYSCSDDFLIQDSTCYRCSSDFSCNNCEITPASYPTGVVCKSCREGFYLSSNACSTSCPELTEMDSNARICKKCTYYDELKKVCVESCGVNKYSEEIMEGLFLCKLCSEFCDTCDKNECKICQSNYFLNDTGFCIKTCPNNGSYVVSTDLVNQNKWCRICDEIFPYCLVCDELACKLCQNSYYLEESTSKCIGACNTDEKTFFIKKQATDTSLGVCISCAKGDCKTCQVNPADSSKIMCLTCDPSKFFDEITNLCRTFCPTIAEKYTMIDKISEKGVLSCYPCKKLIPYCEECSKSTENDDIICSKCSKDRLLDKISNDCEALATENWNIALISRYYPIFEETGCTDTNYHNYKCNNKITLPFCKEVNFISESQQVCISCVDGYVLFKTENVCLKCPENCETCQRDYLNWSSYRYCYNKFGSFIGAYYLATKTPTPTYASCPSNCKFCEDEINCLTCLEDHIIYIPPAGSQRICKPCDNLLTGCSLCNYAYVETNIIDLSLSDIRSMKDYESFQLILNLKKAKAICKLCTSGYFFNVDLTCKSCSQVIPLCESCVNLNIDDKQVFNYTTYSYYASKSTSPPLKIICYQCQRIDRNHAYRYGLSLSFTKCEECPSPTTSDQIKALECAYYYNNLTYYKESEFSAQIYSSMLEMASYYKFTILKCPEKSCMHYKLAVCVDISSISNCNDCSFISKGAQENVLTCSSCEKGYFLDSSNECSKCSQEGCIECRLSNSVSQCLKCDPKTHSLDLTKRSCKTFASIKFEPHQPDQIICKSWVFLNEDLVKLKNLIFCTECPDGYYPSLNSLGCNKCSCIGCYETYNTNNENITSYVSSSNYMADTQLSEKLSYLLEDPATFTWNEMCTACPKANQVLDSENKCQECNTFCTSCRIQAGAPICDKCSQIDFNITLLNTKNISRSYNDSPIMVYTLSKNYFNSLNYLKNNIPYEKISDINNILVQQQFFSPEGGLACRPCPYGCVRCDSMNKVSTNSLDQYNNNCTECRSGFVLDKIGDLLVCKFCPDMNSCSTKLIATYLVSCDSSSNINDDSSGYIRVGGIESLLNEIENLKAQLFKNIYNELYLEVVDIKIFFEANSHCSYPNNELGFQLSFPFTDLAKTLKIENIKIYFGSYESYSNGNIKIDSSEKSNIEIFSSSKSIIDLSSFGVITIKNLNFIIYDGPKIMTFNFKAAISLFISEVELISSIDVSNTYFLMKLDQALEMQIYKLKLTNLSSGDVNKTASIFDAPKVVALTISFLTLQKVKLFSTSLFAYNERSSLLHLENILIVGSELNNSAIMNVALPTEIREVVSLVNIKVESSFCLNCQFFSIRGFQSVKIVILEFKSNRFESQVLNGQQTNSLMAFNTIPNMDSVSINNNIFKEYKILQMTTFLPNQSYLAISLSNVAIGENTIVLKNTSSIIFFLDFSLGEDIVKSSSITVINMEIKLNIINFLDDHKPQSSTLILFSLKSLQSLYVSSLTIINRGQDPFFGKWAIIKLERVEFNLCSFSGSEKMTMSSASRLSLISIENTFQVTLNQINVANLSFFESAIKISNQAMSGLLIEIIEIKKGKFENNSVQIEEFTDGGLIKINSQFSAKLYLQELEFLKNSINRENIFYSKSASCVFIDALQSSIYFSDSNFELNTANTVFIKSKEYFLTNTEFNTTTNNNGKSEFNPVSLLTGGFIDASSEKLIIKDVNFTLGIALVGGALHFTCLKNSYIQIEKTIFDSVLVLDEGGAILIDGQSSEFFEAHLINIKANTTFAGKQGGFLFIKTSSKNVNSYVILDSIIADQVVALNKGSFLATDYIEVQIKNCIFEYSDSETVVNNLKLIVKQNLNPFFATENQIVLTASSFQSFKLAPMLDIQQSSLKVFNTSFGNFNFNYSSSVILSASNSYIEFYASKVFSSQFSFSGLLSLSGCYLYIMNSTFQNLSTPKIMIYPSSIIQCQSCETVNINFTDVITIVCSPCEGGFLKLLSAKDKVTLHQCFFKNFRGADSGGVIYAENSNLNLSHSNFLSLRSETEGGAVYSVGKSSSLDVFACSFESASSTKGGALNLENGVVRIKASKFLSVLAQTSGGAVSATGCKLIIEDSLFKETRSYEAGGSIAYEGISSLTEFTIVNTTFLTTRSRYKGGALYVSNSNLTINLTTFQASLKAEGFSQNSNKGETFDGGFLYLDTSNVNLTNCKLIDSIADYGAMIIVIGNDQNVFNFWLKNSTLTGGVSTFYGGALMIQKMNVSINHTTFHNFTSFISAGVIGIEGSPSNPNAFFLLIENTDIAFSYSFTQGGGIVAGSINIFISQSNFQELRSRNYSAGSRRLLSETNVSSYGGAIYIRDGIFNITKSAFSMCNADYGGAIFSESISAALIIISDTTFESNEAGKDGGAIYFSETLKVQITKCEFVRNKAGNEGGALKYYTASTDGSLTKLILQKVLFRSNFAKIGAAMKYFNPTKSYETTDVTFDKNNASLFGSNISSLPKSMRLVISTASENKTILKYYLSNEFVMKTYRSGAEMNFSLSFELLDENGEKISSFENKDDYKASINIYGEASSENTAYQITKAELTASQTVALINNTFSFLNLTFIGTPNTSGILKITSDQIKVATINQSSFTQLYEFNIKINFRDCLKGEYENLITGTCDECKEGWFSFSKTESCQRCPENVRNCSQAELNVNPGYWRVTGDSKNVLKCLYKEENCLGGTKSGNEMCLEGSIGARCEACDIYSKFWPKHFTKSGSYSCFKCDNQVLNILTLVLLTLLKLIITAISIKGTLNMTQNEVSFRVLKRFYAGGAENLFLNKHNLSAVYIKIFVNYIQIVSFISGFELQLDSRFFDTPEIVGQPEKRFLYALDCYVMTFIDILSGFNLIYVKMIIISLMPLALTLIFLLFYYLFYFIGIVKIPSNRILFTTIVFIIIYLQPNILTYIFSVLSCRKIGDLRYIKVDVSLECYTNDHFLYGYGIGVPLAVLWGILVPIFLIYKLNGLKKRGKLESMNNIIRYGFLYSEYKPDDFYWEFVKLYTRFFMIGFLNFFDTDIVIKGLLVLLTLSLYYYLLVKKEPYKMKKLQRVDKISCAICYISILLALMCYSNPYSAFVLLCLIIIAIINITFSIFCLKKILNAYTLFFSYQIENLQMSLSSILPCLTSCFMRKKKKFKTLHNWRRLKLAVHHYLISKSQVKKDDGVELELKAMDFARKRKEKTVARKDNEHEQLEFLKGDDINLEVADEKKAKI